MAAPTLPGLAAPKVHKDATWVAALRESARAIQDKNLWDCSPDELLIVGRYHALRFAGCTKDERRNKSKGRHIRAGLANLGREAKKRWDRYRVRDYVSDAKRVWTDGGEMPWFCPWDIVGVWESTL